MNRFAAWEAHNTAKFAQDAAKALYEQDELIKSLQADLKTAIRAYRHLIIESEKMIYPSIPTKEFKWTSGADVQSTWRKWGWVPPSEKMTPPLPEKK